VARRRALYLSGVFRFLSISSFLVLFTSPDCVPRRAIVGGAPVSANALVFDAETVAGMHHFGDGYPAQNGDGSVNAVIEIPCGTTAKFEVDETDGWLHWQHDRYTGARREIDYLPFLINYGMVPRTLAADGDALDIVVLGKTIERGHIAATRVIGVLKMADEDGTRDDKLIAVPLEQAWQNGFSRLRDLDELDAHYAAARDILLLWFSNYWGKGATNVIGWGDAREAAAILDEAKTKPERTARHDAADLRLRARSPFGVLVR
jgi:inorganic pyrophosphatase